MFRNFLICSLASAAIVIISVSFNQEARTNDISVLDTYTVIDCNNGAVVDSQILKWNVVNYDIIYVLESHGDRLDHLLQREITDILFRNNSKIVLAYEHFKKNANNHQELLDLYRDGKITYEEFRDGISPILGVYPAMEPLLRLIGERAIKSLAINIPIPLPEEVILKGAVTIKSLRKKLLSGKTLKDGFNSLSIEEKLFLPKDGFKILCDSKFHDFVMESSSGDGGHGNDKITSQIIHTGFWVMNEVMARSILDFIAEPKNNCRQMLIATGIFHGIFNNGIRASVAERNKDLKQVTIMPISEDDIIFYMMSAGVEDFSDKSITNFIIKEKYADYVVLYKKKNFVTTEEFKKQVNEMAREVGELINLRLTRSIDCEIIDSFKAFRVMKDFYSPNIRGLYLDGILYFIERDKEITAQSAKALIAHEGTHAIQDQWFDLKRIHNIQESSSWDRAIAIDSLIEGHAVYAMILFYEKDGNKHIRKMLDQPFFKKDGTMVKQDSILQYRYGGRFIEYLYGKGGWDLVKSAFMNRLPDSTEQIMHPEKYLRNEPPIDIIMPIPRFYEVTRDGMEGEIGVLFTLLKCGIEEVEALNAAEGWGGDRWLAMKEVDNKDKEIFWWKTSWDTEKDAGEFFNAYIQASTNSLDMKPIKENGQLYSWINAGKGLIRTAEKDGLVVMIKQVALRHQSDK